MYFARNAAFVAAIAGTGAVAFYSGLVPAWLGVVWVPVLFATTVGRYTLMLHAVAHRPVVKREHRWVESAMMWVLGPFFGHTPTSFPVHHMGMHHPENNMEADLSSTIGYQRDRLDHFLHYFARFFFVGTVHLPAYLLGRGRTKLARRFLVGELAWLVVVGTLLVLAPGPTLVVFIAPVVILRWLMMCGNWAQHAFVDVDDPDNAYRNSTCMMNTPYNHMCFNDGYHIVHHLKPTLHWTEMPDWFLDRAAEFGAQDAVVFSGLENNQSVWWCLMTQQWGRLADHLVDLPGQPVRSRDEKIAWLQGRVRRTQGVAPRLVELQAAA